MNILLRIRHTPLWQRFPPPDAAAHAAHVAGSDPMIDIHPNTTTTGASRLWTPEEDAKRTSAITNARKMKWGKEYKTDWAVIATLLPGRTKNQCCSRWHDALDPSIDRVIRRTGAWTEDEVRKLKYAVQTHVSKDWVAIAALVPGRTNKQCHNRWHDALDPSIDWAKERTGKWAEDEDVKLKGAVQTDGGNNWAAVATLVPGRTKNQCYLRWHDALDPSIDRANGRTGVWTENEDIKLKDAVMQTHEQRDSVDRWTKYVDPYRSTVRVKEHGTLNTIRRLLWVLLHDGST